MAVFEVVMASFFHRMIAAKIQYETINTLTKPITTHQIIQNLHTKKKQKPFQLQ